ncbi:hypothetical protein Q0N88_14415, partial [Bacillus thuringiensis]|uniref:hypothetical protein n=1 Tax=Bacillus thuringiensis TaxID=1428 RepID=UPI0034584BFD
CFFYRVSVFEKFYDLFFVFFCIGHTCSLTCFFTDCLEIKQLYQVKSDTEMDSEVKRSELDRLDEEMRALAREGITIFRPDYK